MSFEQIGIQKELIVALKKEKINKPTKVQEKVIPKVMEGKNLIVQSQTGTGKTLTYLLGTISNMFPIQKGMQVLVLVPTHELAMQVHRQVTALAKNGNLPFSSTTIVGNVNIKRQVENLKVKPQIVIGTTGRILELIKKKKITAHTIQSIVIDEADKLLDSMNVVETKAIIKCCMRDTQLLLFSASVKPETVAVAKAIKENLEVITMSEKTEVAKNIQHIYFVCDRRDKLETFRKVAKIIDAKKAIVFINKTMEIEEAATKLKFHKFSCATIHGKSEKSDRQKAIREFGNGQVQYLVATDLAARGLHFQEISTVFNISMPEDPMDYLHRSGRAGRGAERGMSVSFITKEELSRIKAYQKKLGINMVAKKLYQGKIVKG